MSKYTTEVRYICETMAGLTESEGYNSINEIIENAIPHIFDFDYPMFDENYRRVLEKKIIKHYYTREICMETYGLWKLKLDDRMNIIMPYYNELYKSAALEFNPFWDTDLTTDRNTDTKGNSSSTSKNVRDNADKVKNNGFTIPTVANLKENIEPTIGIIIKISLFILGIFMNKSKRDTTVGINCNIDVKAIACLLFFEFTKA